MAKSYKIKRYRHIYRRRRFSPVKAALLLLLLAALAFVGFSLYGPVSDFWSGRLLQRLETSSGIDSAEEPAASSLPEPEPVPEPVKPEPAAVKDMHAVHIPEEILLSGQAVAYLQGLSLPDINTALIDLKNESGQVLFQSHVELAAASGIRHERAVDLPATVSALREAGYEVAGRLCAFRDPAAPGVQKAAAVKYEDTDWTWLDNSQEAGGRPWLNPYSPIAQDYIGDLANEAVGAGVKLLFVTHIQFPDGLGRDLATFGEQSAAISQADALRSFVEALQERLLPQGATVIPCVSGIHLLGQKLENPYNGVNPAAIFTGPILSVQMMPALFGEVFEAENSFRLSAPATTPFETVQAVAGRVRATLPEEAAVIPWLQGYTAQSMSTAANLAYTDEQVAQQVAAAAAAGMDSYIIEYTQ